MSDRQDIRAQIDLWPWPEYIGGEEEESDTFLAHVGRVSLENQGLKERHGELQLRYDSAVVACRRAISDQVRMQRERNEWRSTTSVLAVLLLALAILFAYMEVCR